MKRLGILGGTFNPIHISHLLIARTAMNAMSLDKVLIMPSKNPPHKQNMEIASDEDRMNMVRLAIEDEPGFEETSIELRREGLSYTSDTLEILREKYPDTKLYFIIGGDSLKYFDTWHEPEKILRRCALVCTGRAGQGREETVKIIKELEEKYKDGDFVPEIHYVNAPQMDISSYIIRKYVSYGMGIQGLIKPEVATYIFKTRLFRSHEFDTILIQMESLLSPHRFTHVKNVAHTAVRMAMLYGEDMDKAFLAGLLHDCAKYLDDDQMLDTANQYHIQLEEVERKSIQLVHAKVGAVLAKEVYGIEDEEILNAIKYHTTGRPEMSRLEKIIYVADYIEPGRSRMNNGVEAYKLNLARSYATIDLDMALKLILKETYEYLMKRPDYAISDMTIKAYEYYKDK